MIYREVMILRCWRCGRRIKEYEAQKLCLICGLKVTVCADDRLCYDKGLYPKAKVKKRGDKYENLFGTDKKRMD